jgi:two-component system, sensor histidine kinase and response regulator
MIEIGKVSPKDIIKISTLRQRLLNMCSDFGLPKITATRAATIISELLALNEENIVNSELKVNLNIFENKPVLELIIDPLPPKADVFLAERFFSTYTIKEHPDKSQIFSGMLPFPPNTDQPSETVIDKWKELFSEPSREALFRDIRDQNKELEIRKAGMAALIEALPDITIIYDSDGTYLDIFTGQTDEVQNIRLNEYKSLMKLIGLNIKDVLPLDIAKNIQKAISLSLSSLRTVSIDYSLETTAGLRWYDARFSPMKIVESEKPHVVSVARDITDIKKLTRELAESKEEAEAATKAKGDFLANMSHEIRTPMNAIIGLSNLISKTEMSEKQQDYIEKISRSARNLLGIINDILDFSKIEAGKMDIEETQFLLNDVLVNLSNVIGEKVRAKGLEFIFRQDLNVPNNLIGDPLRLGQILLNLTNNAIKFTEKGEIVVTTKLQEIRDGKAKVSFMVSDSGIGLTEEQQGKLFKSFSQADSSTTRKYGGTGLGLAISKKLSELMGGEIGVESVYEQGSTFFFSANMGIAETRIVPLPPDDLKNINVLVVDDNETAGEVLLSYLEDFSFHGRYVTSGELALRELIQAKATEQKVYDLVLMDYQMPGLNGFETSRKIRNELDNVEQPKIIMVTAYGREEILHQSEEIGLDGFLIKPVSPSMLFDSIMQVFGKVEMTVRTGEVHKEEKPMGFEKIRGARILLAEDNEINQQVALETLVHEGFKVEIVNNGKEALDSFREGYDCILMDLQMPEMDGFEATRRIRMEIQDLPIIAMTADAMVGVRERVLEAGMNDYVTKPFDPMELWNALVKWIIPADRELPEDFQLGICSDEVENEDDIPCIPGIDLQEGLSRVRGNHKLYRNLLLKFSLEYHDADLKILNYLQSNDRITSERFVHTVKGTAGNLGAKELQESAAVLEAVLKESTILVNHSALEDFLAKLMAIVKSIEESGLKESESESSSDKKISPKKLLSYLEPMKEHLKKRQPKKCISILEELEDYSIPDDMRMPLDELSQSIKKYQLKTALNLLEDLLSF